MQYRNGDAEIRMSLAMAPTKVGISILETARRRAMEWLNWVESIRLITRDVPILLVVNIIA